MAAGNNGDVLTFTVNGVDVSYTVDVDGAGADDDNAATLAANVVNAINTAITAYNADATHPNKVTIEAVVGDGVNAGRPMPSSSGTPTKGTSRRLFSPASTAPPVKRTWDSPAAPIPRTAPTTPAR